MTSRRNSCAENNATLRDCAPFMATRPVVMVSFTRNSAFCGKYRFDITCANSRSGISVVSCATPLLTNPLRHFGSTIRLRKS